MTDLACGLDFVAEDRARSVTTERRPMRIGLIVVTVVWLRKIIGRR